MLAVLHRLPLHGGDIASREGGESRSMISTALGSGAAKPHIKENARSSETKGEQSIDFMLGNNINHSGDKRRSPL